MAISKVAIRWTPVAKTSAGKVTAAEVLALLKMPVVLSGRRYRDGYCRPSQERHSASIGGIEKEQSIGAKHIGGVAQRCG